MKKINDGGPLFYIESFTLRDYFAGQALIGILAENNVVGNPSAYAKMCYDMADAMIKSREAKP